MERDVLSLIKDRMHTMSKGQKKIAGFILESCDKAAFLTASRLGEETGVSESTVVRFSMELGYSGFPEMQKELRELVLNKLTSVQRMESANDRLGDKDVVSLVMQQDAAILQSSLENIDRNTFNRVVDAVLNARRIYILGVRSSATIGYFLNYYFNYMFDNVKMVSAPSLSEVFEQLVRVEAEDVVIAISYPRYSRSTVRATRYCKSVGATVVAFTDSVRSPIAEYADMLLPTQVSMFSLVDSLVAPLSLANALLVAVSRKKEAQISGTFNMLETIWDEYGVYEKADE